MLLIPPVDKMWQQKLCDFVYIFHSIWTKRAEKASRCAAPVMKPSWVTVCTYWREARDQRARMKSAAAAGRIRTGPTGTVDTFGPTATNRITMPSG